MKKRKCILAGILALAMLMTAPMAYAAEDPVNTVSPEATQETQANEDAELLAAKAPSGDIADNVPYKYSGRELSYMQIYYPDYDSLSLQIGSAREEEYLQEYRVEKDGKWTVAYCVEHGAFCQVLFLIDRRFFLGGSELVAEEDVKMRLVDSLKLFYGQVI